MVFRASFIQINEVHTNPPLFRLLLHHDCIGQPLKIKYYFNCSSALELVYLFFYYLGVLLRRASKRLPFGHDCWIHI